MLSITVTELVRVAHRITPNNLFPQITNMNYMEDAGCSEFPWDRWVRLELEQSKANQEKETTIRVKRSGIGRP